MVWLKDDSLREMCAWQMVLWPEENSFVWLHVPCTIRKRDSKARHLGQLYLVKDEHVNCHEKIGKVAMIASLRSVFFGEGGGLEGGGSQLLATVDSSRSFQTESFGKKSIDSIFPTHHFTDFKGVCLIQFLNQVFPSGLRTRCVKIRINLGKFNPTCHLLAQWISVSSLHCAFRICVCCTIGASGIPLDFARGPFTPLCALYI
mmetsp:Transcript_56853/g.101450  ORF Transcript_56853/g.101450 Transcript_56853/m.101450 type:complete len:203 (+) Transcript_56853:243-851(+)